MALSMKASIAILILSHIGHAADEAGGGDACSACVAGGGSWQIGGCQDGDCPLQDVGCCRVTSREEALAQGPGYPMEWVGLGHALKCCQDEAKQGGIDGGFGGFGGGFDEGFGGPPPALEPASKGGEVRSDPAVYHDHDHDHDHDHEGDHEGVHGGCRSPARGNNCAKCCTPALNEDKGDYSHCNILEWDCSGSYCEGVKPWYNAMHFSEEPCAEDCSPW